MHGFVAPTHQDWFEFLSALPVTDEVNFWAPSGRAALNTVSPGAPFFFKLKSPHHAIGGFGYLGPIATVPLSLAWEAFGQKNGAADREQMTSHVLSYRTKAERSEVRRGAYDPPVGCRTILHPVFFPRDQWVDAPSDWSRYIVQGKTYDLTIGEGRRIWEECQNRAAAAWFDDAAERYGAGSLVRPRLGQGAFRLAVTDAYGRACAVTGEHSLPVLDSAHIQPYADNGPHEVTNGLLLRTDIHRLYDRGYVTVTPDYEFRVSDALRDEYANGRVYYELERATSGRRIIQLPQRIQDRPDRDRLAWHGAAVFRG